MSLSNPESFNQPWRPEESVTGGQQGGAFSGMFIDLLRSERQMAAAAAPASERPIMVCQSEGFGPGIHPWADLAGQWSTAINRNPFNTSSGALGLIVGVDVDPTFISGIHARLWPHVSQQIGDALSGNQAQFDPIRTRDGRIAAVRASDNGRGAATVPLVLEGRTRNVEMRLPGMPHPGAVALFVVRHPQEPTRNAVIAVDPASRQSWRLDTNLRWNRN